jgi:predicted RNA-binding protein with PIN domain
MAAPLLLVDGHNVIFAWPELRALQARRKALARERLVKILTELQDITGMKVAVVFDGTGAGVTEETQPGGIQIFYSPAGKTADDVIERFAACYASTREITVVTSDTLEQDTVSAAGASTLSPEGLMGMIEDARADFARRMKARRRC